MTEDDNEDLLPTADDKQEKLTGNIQAAELAVQLTPLEKKFAEQVVYHRKKGKAAMKAAGSMANDKYLSRLAWEMERRPHVSAYISALKEIVSEDALVTLAEIVSNARRGIEEAYRLGKPRDAAPHNQLLAEIGGHIKSGPSVAIQQNLNSNPQPKSEGTALDDELAKALSFMRPKLVE